MKNFTTLSTSTAFFTGVLLITGCSSDDAGGGGATVPANAIVIDSSNAEITIQSAASSADDLATVLAVDSYQFINLQSALDVVKPLLKNLADNPTANTSTGITYDEPCSGGGSISGSFNSSGDDTNYSESGSGSFNACVEAGFTINGSIAFSNSGNYVTGAYTENASGSLNMLFNGGSDSFKFTGFVLAITGNYQTFEYSINQLTYSIDYVIGGTQGGGFLVTLTAPIVENNGGSFSCPESGHITVTGANGTTAEGIYNGDNTMTIKANGEVINASATCYY